IQTALATVEVLLPTLLTGLAGSSAQSSGGGRDMGQTADARARPAQVTEKEQARVKLDMSRRELGELGEWWKAVERARRARRQDDAGRGRKPAEESSRNGMEEGKGAGE